jgi:hypothetical protein
VALVLEIAYRPAELRDALGRVADERRDVAIRDVRWALGADVRFYDVVLSPLFGDDRSFIGTRISFSDVTIRSIFRASANAR